MSREVCANEVKQEFGWVDLKGHWIVGGIEVAFNTKNGAKVACLALRQKTEGIEEIEGFRAWLVDTTDDDQLGRGLSRLLQSRRAK